MGRLRESRPGQGGFRYTALLELWELHQVGNQTARLAEAYWRFWPSKIVQNSATYDGN